MSCTPSTLFVDFALWAIPGVTDRLQESFKNLPKGDPYDCGLTSVPCESNLTKALLKTNPTLTFWFDLIVVYNILTIFLVAGLVGNVINIVIFSTNEIVSGSTKNLILALSVSDVVNLLSTATLMTSWFLCFVDESSALALYSLVFNQVAFFTRWSSLLSLDFVTVIAMQRAAAVVFPFKISIMFSRRNTNIIITVLSVLCIATIIPIHFQIIPKNVFHPYFDKNIFLGIHYRDYEFAVDYTTCYFYVRSAIDLALTVTAVSITVHKLRKQAENRASLKAGTSSASQTSSQKISVREAKVAKMSLAVCTVTFIIFSLSILVNGATQANAEELFRSPFSGMGEFTLFLLVSINSSFNFFLYLRMSTKFRDILFRKKLPAP